MLSFKSGKEDRDEMTRVKIYTMALCIHCDELKRFLRDEKVEFEELNIWDRDNLADLRLAGVFSVLTPILRVNDKFMLFYDLFSGNKLRKEEIREFLRKCNV